MKKKNHITFAAIFVLIFILTLGYFNLNLFSFTTSSIFIIVLLTIFYALLPDIDHKNSTITWFFIGIGVLGLIGGILEIYHDFNLVKPSLVIIFSTLLIVATYVAVTFFSHRGFIHSIPVGLISVIQIYLTLGFGYGCLAYVAWHSHLIGDGFFLKFK